jgi:hypothetical protein
VSQGDKDFLLAVALALVALGVILTVLFFITLHRALNRCRPQNRAMQPWLVWMNLIPFVNLVWQFVTVFQLAASLSNEFGTRGWHRGADYGRTSGIVLCGLNVGSVIPDYGLVCAIGGFVLWIVYWVQIAGYGAQLADAPDAGASAFDAPRPRDPRVRRNPWDTNEE